MMLHLPQTLPSGALIGGEGSALTKALAVTGGARFIAREADVVRSDGGITGWREASGAVAAATSTPNTGNSRFDPAIAAAFLFEAGVHCGFFLDAFAPEVRRFTAAVIYSSDGEARTLCSVSTGQSNNLIFLSESEGKLTAKDRQDSVEVSLAMPANPLKTRLVVLCFTGRALSVRHAGRIAQSEGSVPAMAHPGSFFFGCRSNRPGLTKTLGSFRLHEVVFWPDRALIGSTDPDEVAALATLDAYHRWTF
jgi:hypothetical protein